LNSFSQIKKLPSFWRGSVNQTVATWARPVEFRPLPPRPLVLVPGAFCTSSVMNRLGAAIQQRGRSVCVPPSFAYYFSALANLCRLSKAALAFNSWLDELAGQADFDEVDVTGHSNGALIALLAQDMVDRGEIDGKVTIRKVVTMATPFGGLPNAKILSFFLPCCRDLVLGSEALRRIERQLHRVVHSLVAEGAFLVPPFHQFPAGGPKTVMEGYQHMDFIVGSSDRIERTAAEVIKWLGNNY